METLGVLFVLFGAGALVVILTNTLKRAKEGSFDKNKVKGVLKRAGTAVAIMIIGGVLINVFTDENEQTTAEDADIIKEESEEDGVHIDIASKSGLESLLNDLLDDKSNTGYNRIEEVVLNEYEGVPLVVITLNADENVTNKLTRAGILKDTLAIMEAMNSEGFSGELTTIWRLPLTDKYGNEEPGKVLSVKIASDTLAKINYDNYDYNNLPNIAESYFEHPGFSN